MRNLFVLLACAFGCSVSIAGEYCWNENLALVITQGENIYFTTDKSCPNWCQVDPALSSDAKKRIFATLLTAKAMGRGVAMYWNEAPAGSQCAAVPAYSKPVTVAF
ncbi:MAG TPA: hypothetical protein VLA61_21345 [Ideonella sp.]|uniref:hypothetical protein n=1 Tax=Ideonella sp. TaxID=1929293 RepID=UPI002C713189|nr:hypothetical protein [Ideonella sp.]HSI50820.1 hypothetical protein [Ideonella sp.]